MFVQATKCKHGSSTYVTYLVRESFRTSKGPRSRTVCNISALPAHTRHLIALYLGGQSLIAADSLDLIEAWSFGGLAVLRKAWDAFGLDRVLSPLSCERHAGLIMAIVL